LMIFRSYVDKVAFEQKAVTRTVPASVACLWPRARG
jgi:hypothetical protein